MSASAPMLDLTSVPPLEDEPGIIGAFHGFALGHSSQSLEAQ